MQEVGRVMELRLVRAIEWTTAREFLNRRTHAGAASSYSDGFVGRKMADELYASRVHG